jgi:hypothetical protein
MHLRYLYQLTPFGSLTIVVDIQPGGKTKITRSYKFSQPLMDAGVPFTAYPPAGMYFHTKNSTTAIAILHSFLFIRSDFI